MAGTKSKRVPVKWLVHTEVYEPFDWYTQKYKKMKCTKKSSGEIKNCSRAARHLAVKRLTPNQSSASGGSSGGGRSLPPSFHHDPDASERKDPYPMRLL